MHNRRSKVVPLRLSWQLLEEIKAAVTRSRDHGQVLGPVNLSTWIRRAILQRLDHLRRSRRRPVAGDANADAPVMVVGSEN